MHIPSRTFRVTTCVIALGSITLGAHPAGARPRQPPCDGGRFLVAGNPLVVGAAAPIDGLTIGAGGVSLGESCESVQPSKYQRGRRGARAGATQVRARWRACPDLPAGVRLRATLDESCTSLQGVLIRAVGRGRREKVPFRATRSTCGDGVVDGAGGETCDPAAATPSCGTLEHCGASAGGCSCLPAIEACVPDDATAKPKGAPDEAMRRLLDGPRIPSVLAASFFQAARRYQQGRTPANPLEAATFTRLAGLAPTTSSLLACALANAARLDAASRAALIHPLYADDAAGDRPVVAAELVPHVITEILQRASFAITGDPACAEVERAGAVRPLIASCDPDDPDNCFVQPEPSICTVESVSAERDVRTRQHRPPLRYGDFARHELDQNCDVDLEGRIVCANRIVADDGAPIECDGDFVRTEPSGPTDFACLHVPRFRAGASAALSGINFFDTDARVRLTPRFAASERFLEAHVCGDVTTPVSIEVGGVEETIADCPRVHDYVTFRVPDDTPPGLYELRVVVPNPAGHGTPPSPEYATAPLVVRIMPPTNTRFGISTERLVCTEETDGLGSDEIGIRFITMTVGPNLAPGEIGNRSFKAEEIDSGESRLMPLELFSGGEANAVAVSVTGHEIDDDELYENGITEYWDAVSAYYETTWHDILSEGLSAAAGAGALLAGAGPTEAGIVDGLVRLVDFAIGLAWAAGARPDLVIEDRLTLTADELARQTSFGLLPLPVDFTSSDGIEVTAEHGTRSPGEYRETRKYRSDDEDSRYEIDFRYERQ